VNRGRDRVGVGEDGVDTIEDRVSGNEEYHLQNVGDPRVGRSGGDAPKRFAEGEFPEDWSMLGKGGVIEGGKRGTVKCHPVLAVVRVQGSLC
jgi:hypothetical protein